jgi:transposase
MSKIREIIRLQAIEKLTLRQIARSVRCSHNTVKLILQRAQEAHIVWPIPEDVSDNQLEEQLYPSSKSTVSPRPESDMDYIEKSMQDKHTNLTLLWVEYKMDHPDGVQYTQFCERYRKHMKKKTLPCTSNTNLGKKCLLIGLETQ